MFWRRDNKSNFYFHTDTSRPAGTCTRGPVEEKLQARPPRFVVAFPLRMCQVWYHNIWSFSPKTEYFLATKSAAPILLSGLRFLISQPKYYMLWVLKRTFSMKRFFWAPNINNFTQKKINTLAMGKCLWFSVKIKVCQSSLSSPWSYPDLSTLWLWNPFRYRAYFLPIL